MDLPRVGELVDRPCIFCERVPVAGEMYGPHAAGWDHTGICPQCWDSTMADPDEVSDAEEAPPDGR